METAPINSPPPQGKRRWYQFSLRTLLILTLILAIPCAWLGRRLERKRRERNAVKAVTAKFGQTHYDYELENRSEADGPAWLRRLLGDDFFSDVHAVTLRGGSHDDCDLAFLQELPELRQLDLQDTTITDAGLEHLSGLSELVRLNLKGTFVSDAGLRRVKGLSRLEHLDLSGTKVGDAALSSLKDLTQLAELELADTAVTDAGAEQLREALPHLRLMNWSRKEYRFIPIVDGLVAYGFDDNQSYLLAISHSGRFVFSTSTWQQLARDDQPVSPKDGYADGIGPLAGQRVRVYEPDSDEHDPFPDDGSNYTRAGLEIVATKATTN